MPFEILMLLLKTLNNHERFVIYRRYIEGQAWWLVTELYNEQFTPARDKRTLQNYAQRALEKMQATIPP